MLKEKLNEIFMPSLKHRALVKVSTALWNPSDIRVLMAIPSAESYNFSKYPREWQLVQDRMTGKVLKLPLPESMKKELLDLIQPISLEILKWKEYHEAHNRRYLDTPLSSEIYWTPQGTVDQKKTSEVYVRDQSLDITGRYRLACFYSLEDYVKQLWNYVPESVKLSYFYKLKPHFSDEEEPVVFWTHVVRKELHKLNYPGIEKSLFLSEFEYSALFGNKAATAYFLKLITPREKNESLVKTALLASYRHFINTQHYTDRPINYDAEVFCFLILQMNEEQQVTIFDRYPDGLLCLLDWPFQSVFVEAANRIWDFLSEFYYEQLLKAIVDKIMRGYMDYNYHKLFGEFWQQSPNSHKKYIIGRCATDFLLISNLFQIEDKENIGLILSDATVKEREDIIFHIEGKYICQNLIYKDKWDLLKFFVQECISSEDSMIKFKGEFKPIIRRSAMRRTVGVKDLWTKFFEFLDELILKDN